MFLNRFFYFLILLLFTSCQFFTTDKNKNVQEIDTIIDFSKVDVSPSFAVCDSLIDKVKKDNCFRTSIHQIITRKLSTHSFKVAQEINETVTVNLLIDASGNVSLQEVSAPAIIKKELPVLDSLLALSVQQLPQLHPALKRGIPVATQYQLPIQIVSLVGSVKE